MGSDGNRFRSEWVQMGIGSEVGIGSDVG